MSENTRPQFVDSAENDPALIEFWTLETLAEVYEDAPEELVPGLVSKNLTMFQGDAGSGKSLIAADLTTAYSTGSKFLGKFNVNVNPNRPNVCYVDQDNFSHKALLDRLISFQCDSSKVVIPKNWFRLDDQASIDSMVSFVKKHRIGLIILDSIHAFHKLRDGKLEYLRDGFKALIAAGTSVVLLSHITKSSSAGDKKAAQGTGLLAATDYTFGFSEVEFGKFKVVPVKIRQSNGEQTSPFLVTYSGTSRPVEEPAVSLAEQIIQHLLDVGEKGTTVLAIRKVVGGDNHAVSNVLKTMPEIYNEGKKGPGCHIWHKHYMPEQQHPDITAADNDSSNCQFSDEDIDFDDSLSDLFASS
jgi:archaellum biogenesis ATPase FlaH